MKSSSSSSSCFLFLLASAASIWNISSAQYPHHQLGANDANAMTKMNFVSTEKGEDVNEEVVSPSTATNIKADKRSIGGRRMAVDRQVTARLDKEVKVSVASGGSSSSKLEANKSSCNGSSSHEGGNNNNNVECRDQSRFNSEKDGDGPDGDGHEEYAGFVAFSQDYHSPRHHPPKNN